ncbi:cytochrome c [Marine Group I thaumarchaeote]|nr:cytochrome c [Marine Group I thaumarchaeote]
MSIVGIIKVKKIFLVLIFLFFSVSACTDPKEVAESESQEAAASVAQMELGLEVFNNKAQCGMCHTLQAAGSEGQIGTNLDQLKPQIPQIISTVTNGIGVMPAFEGMLTMKEIDAVAYYVFESTNK